MEHQSTCMSSEHPFVAISNSPLSLWYPLLTLLFYEIHFVRFHVHEIMQYLCLSSSPWLIFFNLMSSRFLHLAGSELMSGILMAEEYTVVHKSFHSCIFSAVERQVG